MNVILCLGVSYNRLYFTFLLLNVKSGSMIRISLGPIHTLTGHFPADPQPMTNQPHPTLAQNPPRTNTLPLRDWSNQHQGRQPKLRLRLWNPSKISKRSPQGTSRKLSRRGRQLLLRDATSSGCDRRTPIHYRCEKVITPRKA